MAQTFEGHGFTVSHNLDVLAQRMDSASSKVFDVSTPALMECGVFLMGEAQRDYRAKSKGRADEAGNLWLRITEGAIRSRFWRTRRNSRYVKLLADIERLRNKEATLLESLFAQLPPGPEKASQRRAIARDWRENSKEGKEATKTRNNIRAKQEQRRSIVASEHASAAIGVDSGRLVNSLTFGAAEAISEIVGQTLKLGTRIVYAVWFDYMRPIFPENFLTPRRKDRCLAILKKHAERGIQDTLGDHATEG